MISGERRIQVNGELASGSLLPHRLHAKPSREIAANRSRPHARVERPDVVRFRLRRASSAL